jgi:TRAP-type C4-dicarboxylate transport system permease small subunit
MWAAKISAAMYDLLTPFSKVLIFLGGICLTAMMFLTASDVVMRYFFDSPIDGAFDITEYLMVIVFAFALPYCTIKKDHVKVDIFTSRFPKKVTILIDCLTTLISLVLFSTIAWQSLISSINQYNSKIVSSVMQIPRYPFYGLLFFGYLCFAIILLAELLALMAEAERK